MGGRDHTVNTASPHGAPVVSQALVFDLKGETLVGVLNAPAGPAQSTALVMVVGGPQVRVGSHRLFVRQARALAAQGHAVLRFDVRGMGDSTGQPAGFEQQDEDIAAAIAALQARRPEVQRVVLWGLCDGASASLLYLQRTQDPRIAGLVLLNPWVRSVQTLARAQVRHYYGQRLLQPGFWLKLLRGGVGLAALRGWWQNLQTARRSGALSHAANGARAMPFQQRMALGWQRFRGPLLLVLSSKDLTAQEFAGHASSDPHWRGALSHTSVTRVDLDDADHTFSTGDSAVRLLQLTCTWMQQHHTAG